MEQIVDRRIAVNVVSPLGRDSWLRLTVDVSLDGEYRRDKALWAKIAIMKPVAPAHIYRCLQVASADNRNPRYSDERSARRSTLHCIAALYLAVLAVSRQKSLVCLF
jgi:hypothetical protein